MIKVLLADDHIIVRDLIRQLLERAGDIQIVSMASNGQEAVDQVIEHSPDVALVDVSMALMDGVEATRQICAHCTQTRVLAISGYLTNEHVQRSIEAGAVGYVLKDFLAQELIPAVRAISQGERYFSNQVAEIANLYISGSVDRKRNIGLVGALEDDKRNTGLGSLV